jgi:predicted transcriptional regulator
MANVLRLPDLSLGELEREVLEILWTEGPQNPGAMYERVGAPRGISVNTVSSALKRLVEKGLLEREKVSHAYVYRAIVTRAALQRSLFGAIASQFVSARRGSDEGGETSDSAFLAAFVDLAHAQGEDTLRKLEQMVAARLNGARE